MLFLLRLSRSILSNNQQFLDDPGTFQFKEPAFMCKESQGILKVKYFEPDRFLFFDFSFQCVEQTELMAKYQSNGE